MTRRTLILVLLLSLRAIAAESDRAGLQPGTLAEPWLTGGPNCVAVPDWQVHEYNEDFYILRESGCINPEKPFLYLIFGENKVLLEDTGVASAADRARSRRRRWCSTSWPSGRRRGNTRRSRWS